MIYAAGYDDFGVLNGHAIIKDWVAWVGEDGLEYGQITGFREIGKYDSGLPEDMMVINGGDTEIHPSSERDNLYPVVKITAPCTYHCCDSSQCHLEGCKCREGSTNE